MLLRAVDLVAVLRAPVDFDAAFLGAAFFTPRLGAAFFVPRTADLRAPLEALLADFDADLVAALLVAVLEALFLAGTLAPRSRASERPMAIACLRDVTFFPLRPLFSSPRFISCMAFSTFLLAPFEYLAIVEHLMVRNKTQALPRLKLLYHNRLPSSRSPFYAHCWVRFFESIRQKFMIMENNEKVIGIINDLIQINNDRVVGYEKAIDELKDSDADLKTLFSRYIQESKQYAQELTHEVSRLGGNPSDGTTNSGKIYRVWMDLKAAITGKDRQTILNNCEFGEDAAQKAYDMALNADTQLEAPLRELIVRQKAQLKMGHDEVKRLRDLHKAEH